ncbi:Chromosome segregation ATPase [Emericellopsis cladophorae]|uniref:Chromosome segregation ATPase n=1 Tax=Emericellopsis cladophorae TaxID=2686198 RepID=A0A9P9Y9F5_9HYPO|nr:Chromosome segregation ATPase [Emericellopsis cladophorae]KAI6785430.1 Chromosome segregation ATPase [Emericellopsis cladophorae]
MADTEAPVAAPAADTTQQQRPTKPDEDAYNKSLVAAEKAHKAAMDRLNAIKAKIDIAMPKKDAETPTQKRRKELIAQANEIRTKQAGGKKARTSKLDQIKKLDEQLRSRIQEQKNAKGKVSYKSVEDVDREIASLEKQVNSGTMRLVDEKKALADISNLRKVRKNFGQFDDAQRQIDETRAKIKEIKDSMDDPEQKAMSEKYNAIQAELDAIKAEQDEAYKSINSLRDERTKLHAEQQETWAAIRKIKDDYHTQRKAFNAYDREQKDKARERRKAEQEKYLQDRKKAEAETVLAEASDPAYMEEIRRANSLLLFLDPEHKVEKGPLMAESGLTAQATRKVEDAPAGTKLLRKEDREEDLFAPTAKKGKKGKKGGAGGASAKSFNCPPSVVEDCAFMGIDPPMSQADVPEVTKKVRAKLDQWKADQETQTQKNIEKAKKKIEELEKADANGNGVDEATEGVKETSLEDKQES